MAEDNGGGVGRIADVVDQRAEKRGLGLVAFEDVSFVAQAPVAPDAFDNVPLVVQVSAAGIVSSCPARAAVGTCLARYTAPWSAALCSSLMMVYEERRPFRTASMLSSRAIVGCSLTFAFVGPLSQHARLSVTRLGIGAWRSIQALTQPGRAELASATSYQPLLSRYALGR